MARIRIKVVPRTVEIDREQKYRIETILLPVCLRLHEHHLFCKTIRCIRFFRIADPEILFFERGGSEFRICADRADGDKFFHTAFSRFFHELGTHDQIVIIQFSRMLFIKSNPADNRCQMDDHLYSIQGFLAIFKLP